MKIAKNKAILAMKAILASNTRGRGVSLEKQRIWREINEDMLKESLDLLENGLYTVEIGFINDGVYEKAYIKRNIDKKMAEDLLEVFDKHKRDNTCVKVYKQDYDLEVVANTPVCVYERKYYGKEGKENGKRK